MWPEGWDQHEICFDFNLVSVFNFNTVYVCCSEEETIIGSNWVRIKDHRPVEEEDKKTS